MSEYDAIGDEVRYASGFCSGFCNVEIDGAPELIGFTTLEHYFIVVIRNTRYYELAGLH